MGQNITSLSPTAQGERILILDSLRGIAVLGILMMNIPGFSMPRAAYNAPEFSSFSSANFYAWFGV